MGSAEASINSQVSPPLVNNSAVHSADSSDAESVEANSESSSSSSSTNVTDEELALLAAMKNTATSKRQEFQGMRREDNSEDDRVASPSL
jgi:hypothetical protein